MAVIEMVVAVVMVGGGKGKLQEYTCMLLFSVLIKETYRFSHTRLEFGYRISSERKQKCTVQLIDSKICRLGSWLAPAMRLAHVVLMLGTPADVQCACKVGSHRRTPGFHVVNVGKPTRCRERHVSLVHVALNGYPCTTAAVALPPLRTPASQAFVEERCTGIAIQDGCT